VAARVYVTIDEWESRAVYEEIRPKFAKEYAELDWTCEGMTTREKHLYSLRLELAGVWLQTLR
jgi:hypothetical protein